jgi:peptidoglycan/xylan/chitin deacetylase (PgdA/CDA1 family)
LPAANHAVLSFNRIVRMIYRPKKMSVLRWLPKPVVLTKDQSRGKTIYLTFDDGPNPQHTPALLDLLRAHGAQSSFFLIGREAERYPQLVERIVAEGHRLGNHSYSHPVFSGLPLSKQLAEIERTDQILASFDGARVHRFRPPRGAFSLALMLHFAWHRRNLTYWSYDTLDYQRKPPADLIELLRARPPSAGDVMLMHDDSDRSTHMLAALLPEWRASGFTFSALSA